MSIQNDFAERFTILKETYNLSYSDFANLLGIRNKSTVNFWVKSQKGFPSKDMLIQISRTFAVSLDWLLGNVSIDTPYREDFINEIEKRTLPIWERVYEKEGGYKISEKYKDPVKRGQFYNLGQRANLIYGAMSVFYVTLFTKFTFKELTDTDADPMIISKAEDYIANTELLGIDTLYMGRMWHLIRGETSITDKPPYDITVATQDVKNYYEMNTFKGPKRIYNDLNPLRWIG